MNKNIPLIILILVNFNAKAQYCAYPQLFIEQSSFGIWDYTSYANGCMNPGGSDTCNIYLYKPNDILINEIPLRPAIVGVHGLCELGDVWDPFCNQWTAFLYTGALHDAYLKYGFVVASVQYKQWVDSFNIADPCQSSAEEFARTHYRAIVDVRKAVKKLYDNAPLFSIDKNNIFLYGNSQGGMAVLHAAFLTDENEFFNRFPDFAYLKDEYGPLAPRVPIKGVINLSGFLYALDFLNVGDTIPMFLAHGSCDEIIPYQSGKPFFCADNDFLKIHGSLSIAAKAHQAGIPYSLHTINNMGHAWTDSMQATVAGSALRSWIKNEVICGTPQNEQFFYDAQAAVCPENYLSPQDILSKTESTRSSGAATVFPNPFSESITIQKQHYNTSKGDVFIYDVNGALVFQKNDCLNESINLENLNSGVYFMCIKIENKDFIIWKKIIKVN
jgi:predicted esterase